MLKKTDVCELLEIEYPIVQAPMGPYKTTNLCAAVSNAGGLGTISHTGTFLYLKERAPEIYEEIRKSTSAGRLSRIIEMEKSVGVYTIDEVLKVKDLTDKPFAVNVRVTTVQPDAPYLIDAIIEEREKDPELKRKLKVVITSAGNPALYTNKLKDAGLKVIHVVPSVYHAKKAEEAGVDAVVASGHEAGGHVAWEPVHTTVLLPAVRKAVKIPVLSAGGWCDGKGLVAALALGAGAIYMGTRFIATRDSDFGQGYKEAILKATERDTIVTVGDLGPCRMLKNKYTLGLQKVLDSVTGTFESKFENPEVEKWKEKANVTMAEAYVRGSAAAIENAPCLTGEVQGSR
jgi:enoyl-[acyl-carrier protein] reductase II